MVLEREMNIVKAQLQRNGVTTLHGMARFVDPHTLEIPQPMARVW
jgi:pyruvate/2-oxoglutarate dehydrogenase complex dihydrolipoamide dehydrogenase (E3) component